MALDDIKERFREQFQGIAARVQESTPYIQLMEKYNDLSPRAQKGALAGAVAVISLILLAIPYSFFSSSQDETQSFEDKKQVIRDAYQVSRKANSLPPSPPAMSASELQGAMQNEFNMAHLQPDQIVSVVEFDNSNDHPSPTLPKNLTEKGVVATLHKLNLKQLTDIGTHLQALRPTTKMVGIEITATREDAHYFDVIYKVVAFALPAEANADKKGPKGKK